MELGPVELFVLGFPGNQFTGEIAPALADLVEQGTIRVIDLLFVGKADDGTVAALELHELDDDVSGAYDALVDELSGLISHEDVEDFAEELPPGSSAALLLIEHTWATRFATAIADSGGELITSMHIPREALEEVLAARDIAAG